MDHKLSLHLDAIHAEEQRIKETMPPGIERTARLVRLGYWRRKLERKVPQS